MIFLFITLLALLLIYFLDRRSLFYGGLVIATVFFILILLIFIFGDKPSLIDNEHFISRIIFILVALLVLCLVIGPIIFIFILIFKGIQLIFKEGFNVRNLLALSVGIILLINNIFSVKLLDSLPTFSFWYYSYVLLTLCFNYLLFLSSLYTISSWINFLNFKRTKLDYIIVLGAGLIGDKVTPLLASRINKGIDIYKKNPDSKLIMSGGQGADELISEALAMKNHALNKGVPKEDIILENQSKNTFENLRFSNALVNPQSKLAIVTNYYHLFRALIIAKEANIKCIGYGAKTKLYFSINAFIREFIGYLYLKRKFHIIFLSIFSIIYIIITLIIESFV
ncbi:YdcF family protein [Mammaliicoccus vitulinus]|uniref:YdcF family protein n=1 Tax=Mammaliicoccus vitulinus TaxID=71237 RepID=UPI003BA1881D